MLKGRKCLVTGGSRGIGLAIAKRVSREGAQLTLVGRNEDSLKKAIAQLDGTGHSSISLDIGEASQVALNRSLLSDNDILINNAGLSQHSLLIGMKPEDVIDLVNVNLVGTILMTQALLKHMIRRKYGRIVNISSILATQGYQGSTIYSATKAGIEGFTLALAKELGGRNIHTNCLRLGLVDTEMGRAAAKGLQGNQMLHPDTVAESTFELIVGESNGQILTLI